MSRTFSGFVARFDRPMIVLIAVISMMLISATTTAQDDVAAGRPWTVDDVIQQPRAGSWTLRDDGGAVLWVKRVADKKTDGVVATLMITELPDGQARPLTVGKNGVSSLAFVPDGHRVSFLSSRDFPDGTKGPKKDEKGAQIWTLDLRGGEARPLTSIPFGVSGYRWIDDATVILQTREAKTRREAEDEDRKDKTIVVESVERFQDTGRQMFRYDAKTKKLERLTTASFGPVQSFEASPNGRYLVVRHGRSPFQRAEGNAPPRCFLYDLETGISRELLADRQNKPGRFAFRPDSSALYFLQPHSTIDGKNWAAIATVMKVELPAGDAESVDLDWAHGLASPTGFQVTDDGFLCGLANGMEPKVVAFHRHGEGYRRADLQGEHARRLYGLVKAKKSDRVVYLTGTASDPDHVMTARLDGDRLVDVKEICRPAAFADRTFAKTEIIRYTGAENDEIEALVYYPHDYEAGKRYPLVLMTHGGPHGADFDRFRESWAYAPNLYCQRGAFVLRVNYHGSSDYGLAFGESIRARYYELEIEDMFAGIRKLVDEGKVDPAQLGLVGWSNGAILSIGALTLAHLYAPEYDWKFKACAPGAGDVNWTSDYGNCAFGASFDDFYLGGSPWEIPDVYLKKSPLFHVDRVTTPTIIFFGTNDTSVPTEQGWEWYRALRVTKKAPVRFLLFPGEPHGLRKLSHQRRKLAEELAWFDRYLFAPEAAESTEDRRNKLAVKKGSPLDHAMRRRTHASHVGAYGVHDAETGHLVPELVPFDGVMVGRFEITRAQWNEFRGMPYDAARRNHPITGIDAEEMKDYAAWLARTTGKSWRLLTKDEFEKLEKASGPKENVLDWWAGYRPSPKDEDIVRARLIELGSAEVLQDVGSRPAGTHRHGAETIRLYDVGGNAAEVVLDGERAVVVGGCALLTKERRSTRPDVPPSFVGFRLACGAKPAKADAANAEHHGDDDRRGR